MEIKKLEKRFPRSKIRQKTGVHGQPLHYVLWPEVVKRLNQVFNGDWSFETVEWQLSNRTLIVLGRLSAGSTVKMQFGSWPLDNDLNFGDALKAAASDSLKRCSVLLGIGLHLYAPPPANRSPSQPTAAISSRQQGLIESLARRLCWSEQELDRLCREQFGGSLEQLERSEASRLIDQMRQRHKDASTAAA